MNQPDKIFELDDVCTRFESAWQRHEEPPNLHEYLSEAAEESRAELFRLLLPLDVAYRSRGSIPVDAEDYHREFPEFSEIINTEFGITDTVTMDQDSSMTGGDDFSADMPDTLVAGPQKSTPHPQPRKQFGRYTALSKLGGGGQADVYRATHPTLPIEVAVKVGKKQLDASTRQAMHDEAQTLCELDHPNIAKIRDLEFDDQGCPILVLELVRGRSLAHVLREGDLSDERIIKWLAAAAEALEYTHRRGIHHLDLKPGNIVITETDEAKVIDFGLARSRQVWEEPIDEENRVCGTPEYMAPEQANGDSSRIGARADVFGLGAILFRILTGGAPFHGETNLVSLRRSQEYDLDAAQLDASSASESLKEICRRAIAKEPADRFESAEAFATALREQTDQPSGPVVSTPQNTRQPSWFLWTISASCAAALIAGLWWMFIRPNETAVQGTSIALEGFQIQASRNKGKFYPIDEVAPIHNDDHVRFSVKLDQPAYVRLLWIDAEGELAELYPNDPEKGPQEPFIRSFESPPELDRGWPILGSSGVETALLLVSQEPLNHIDLASIPPMSANQQSTHSVNRFSLTRSSDSDPHDQTRGVAKSTEQMDDPMMRMLEKLRSQVDLAEAVTVLHTE